MARPKVPAPNGVRSGTVVFRGSGNGTSEYCVWRYHNCAGLLYMLDAARRTGFQPDWDRILFGWEGPCGHFKGQRTADGKVVMEQLVGKIRGLTVYHDEGPDGGKFEVRASAILAEKASWLLSDLRARVEAVLDEQQDERKRLASRAELERIPAILAQGEPARLDGPEVLERVEAMARTLLLRAAEKPRSRKRFAPTGDWIALRVYDMALTRLRERGLGIHDLFYLRAIGPKADSRAGASASGGVAG